MKNETITKNMTDRELAEAIVSDRIAHAQFTEDDRDWLVERELRETRESLVHGYEAIEHWNEADDSDRPFDGDTSGIRSILGDFEWMYDIDARIAMLTKTTANGTFWLRDDEAPDWKSVEDASVWPPVEESIPNIIDWYNRRNNTHIANVDCKTILSALTTHDCGEIAWKPLTCFDVDKIIRDII